MAAIILVLHVFVHIFYIDKKVESYIQASRKESEVATLHAMPFTQALTVKSLNNELLNLDNGLVRQCTDSV